MAACRMIVDQFHGEVPKTMGELLELPGIGRKSANVILGAAYGISSGIVVDTHMIRLSCRFHLTPNEEPEKIENDLVQSRPAKRMDFLLPIDGAPRPLHLYRQIAPLLGMPSLQDLPLPG